LQALLKNVDAFCARLNAGLAAVAIVLSLLVAAQLTVRLPTLVQQAAEVMPAPGMAENSAGF